MSKGTFYVTGNTRRRLYRALRRKVERCVALVLDRRGSDGDRRDYSQLEQGLAALVLLILAAQLAGELLDRPAAGPAPG